jgi:hypothetical protein
MITVRPVDDTDDEHQHAARQTHPENSNDCA